MVDLFLEICEDYTLHQSILPPCYSDYDIKIQNPKQDIQFKIKGTFGVS